MGNSFSGFFVSFWSGGFVDMGSGTYILWSCPVLGVEEVFTSWGNYIVCNMGFLEDGSFLKRMSHVFLGVPIWYQY